MKMKILCFLSLILSIQVFAQNLNIPIPNNPNVKVGKLKNGMKYYILKNAEPKNRMELRLVINAGSILETESQQGLAHFMEHMNFNGTKSFPKNEVVNFLQKSGMKFGADLNASTGFDETVYQLQVPTDSVKLFERAFQILADWTSYATLDTVEINKERGVILEEERARGKNAQSRIQQQLFPYIFNNSIYSKRLPIGKTDVIQNFKYEELISFYKNWYRPDLMAVIAVGDFDEAKVEQMINEKFSAIKKVKRAPKRPIYEVPFSGGTQAGIILDKEFPQNLFQILVRLPRERTLTQNDYRTDISESLFSQMFNTRLQEIAKKPNSPFIFGFYSYSPMVSNIDIMNIGVLPKNAEGIELAAKTVVDEMTRISKFGFTNGEFDRAKKDYFNGVEKRFKEKDKTKSAVLVGGLVSNFLRGSNYSNVDFEFEFTKSQLDKITLEEVKQVANKVFKTEDRAVLIVGPEKEKGKYPSDAKLIEIVNFQNLDIKPYEEDVVLTPILETMPTGSKIVSEKKVEEIGVTELTFANGVKMALKPTNFKNDQILFSGISKGGTSNYSDQEYYSASNASSIASQGGVSKLSDTQLDKALAGKNVNVYTYVGELTEGLGGSASPKDFETALQLMFAKVTQPRLDLEVVKSNLKSEKELIANSLKTLTPDKVFGDSISTIFYQNNLRRQSTKPEDIDKIDIERAFGIYKERFADFSDFNFVMVGSFEIEKIKPLLEKYIGGLPSTNRKESFKDLGIKKLKGKVDKNIYKGLEEKAFVSLEYNGDFSYSDEDIVNLTALSEVLDIRLTEKLREEAGGVYTPSVGSSYDAYPNPNYNLSISFGCSPENAEKLVKITMDEIAKIKANGPSKEDIEKVVAEQKRSTELQLKENGFWNGYLTEQYYANKDVNFINRFNNELINKISIKSVMDATKKFCGENVAKFILLPEKK
jgi:zinc protease